MSRAKYLEDFLEYNRGFIQKKLNGGGHVHEETLGVIRTELKKDGFGDLADYFSALRAEGYDKGRELLGQLDLSREDCQLLKDILDSLASKAAGHSQPLPVDEEVGNCPTSLGAGPIDLQGESVRTHEVVEVNSHSPCPPPLENPPPGAARCVLPPEEDPERLRLEANCAELRKRVDWLESKVRQGSEELERTRDERDALRKSLESMQRQNQERNASWKVLGGSVVGLSDERMLRVVEEVGAGNLRDAADHAVLLALLAVVCRDTLEDGHFLERFVFLEGEIEVASGGDALHLDRLRGFVGPVLSARLARWKVDWNLVGRQFDSSICNAVSDTGTRIVEVLNAAVWRDGACVRKARVKTA